MPSIKDFKNKQQAARPKRRPGRDHDETSEAEVKVVDVETGVQEESSLGSESAHQAATESVHDESAPKDSSSFEEPQDKKPKVEIKFFGSELLRAKLPQPFDVAEAVATDWIHDGKFEELPIKNPIGQIVAQKGLTKAKEIEKKVLESPITEKVVMQAFTTGLKIQQFFKKK